MSDVEAEFKATCFSTFDAMFICAQDVLRKHGGLNEMSAAEFGKKAGMMGALAGFSGEETVRYAQRIFAVEVAKLMANINSPIDANSDAAGGRAE